MGRFVHIESIEEYNARIEQEPSGPKIDFKYLWALVPALIGVLLLTYIKCA